MILELDLGNTRAKWRIVTGRTDVVAHGVAEVADWLAGRFPDSWREGVDSARIASVLSPATENALVAKIQAEFAVSARLAKSGAHCGGVTSAYVNPECLGVDRWLALIAAYKMAGEAVLVVDAGTALKVDVVDDAGHHVGGYIIPGAALMERALLQGTDRVRYEGDAPIGSVMLGRETRSCVQNGIAAALVGAVVVAIGQCRAVIGREPRFYITGGLGVRLKDRLEEAGIGGINVEPDLVLDGLRWVLP